MPPLQNASIVVIDLIELSLSKIFCFFLTQGRGGKGNIYLFSAGNGGYFNVTCGYDEFKTSIYTIVISVVTGKNVRSRQNVKCSAISAVTYARDNALGVSSSDDLMVRIQ